jgi:hypothetical protein
MSAKRKSAEDEAVDGDATPPTKKKKVGTKPVSVIPRGKSVIRILKLKSGIIMEIP